MRLSLQHCVAVRALLRAATAIDSLVATLELSFPLPLKHLSTLSMGLAATTALRCLVLDGCNCGDEGVAILRKGLEGNRSVEELSLAACGITEEGARAICGILKQRTAWCATQPQCHHVFEFLRN